MSTLFGAEAMQLVPVYIRRSEAEEKSQKQVNPS